MKFLIVLLQKKYYLTLKNSNKFVQKQKKIVYLHRQTYSYDNWH